MPTDMKKLDKEIKQARKESESVKKDAKPRYSKEQVEEAMHKFEDPRLLHYIFKELDKDHVGDNKAKVLSFLCSTTALMKSKYRMSFRVCGDSTAGKDNMIETDLKHMPEGTFATYTGTSDKFLVRLVDVTPGVYVGELNLQRQGGANQNIIEVLKAAAEGGTRYGFLEPDEHGKYKPVENKIEKRTVIYSGTEIGLDDELSTRVLSIAVAGTKEQTQAVLNKLAEDSEIDDDSDSWVAIGLSQLDRNLDVRIPTEIKKILVSKADVSDVRARRDAKRLFAIIRASAFLHQLQRPRFGDALYAVNADVYHALTALDETLDRSYSSIEPRLQKVINAIKKLAGDGWVQKSEVVKKARIHGKNRQADAFRTLQGLLVTEEQRNLDDKRRYEVRLTGQIVSKFIKGSVEDIMKYLPHLYTQNIKPISKNGATDSEKIGLKEVELGLDRYPAIGFVDGVKTYLNLSKPIIKPNFEGDIHRKNNIGLIGLGGEISKTAKSLKEGNLCHDT